MIQLLLTASAILLAGALCAALLVAPVGERRPQLVRGGAWALWTAAGFLAASAVVVAIVRLSSGLTRSDTGAAVLVIAFGGVLVATVVCLLGLFGFWAAIRRRTQRPDPVR